VIDICRSEGGKEDEVLFDFAEDEDEFLNSSPLG